MNKLKYLFLFLVMVLLPFNVFASVNQPTCVPDSLYFILEDASGNKIENGDLILESSKKDYSQKLEYVNNGVYKIKYGDELQEYEDSLNITNIKDFPILLIKYNNEYIGAISGSLLKYNKDTDYTTYGSFIDSVYKNTGISLVSEKGPTDEELDKLNSKYTFKDSKDNYPDFEDYSLCEDQEYDESKLPIITYKPSIIENKNHTGSIYIKSSELIDISNNTEELSDPVIKDLQINFDLKFNDLNDYVTYKLIIRNDTDKDYELTNNDFNTSDYITYDFKFDSDDDLIKANSDKIAYVTIKYTKEVPEDKLVNGGYTEDNKLGINFNRKEETIFDNPKTGIKNIIILVILVSIVGLSLYISIRSKSKFRYMNLILLGLVAIPLTAKAIELLQIDVVTHIEITGTKEFCYVESYYAPIVSQSPSIYFKNNAPVEKGKTNYIKTYYKYKDGMTWYDYINNDYNKFNIEDMKKLNPDLYNEPTDESIEKPDLPLSTYYFGYGTWDNESDKSFYYPSGTNTRQFELYIPNSFYTNDYFNCDEEDYDCQDNNTQVFYKQGDMLNSKINDKSLGCYASVAIAV